mmetsp:Transcript_11767/g.16817  ORF Transcript_11767/g.16817 Transcript_11767/m.16817 type:complete len:183 (-) Transcript_11767:1641-2189(-)
MDDVLWSCKTMLALSLLVGKEKADEVEGFRSDEVAKFRRNLELNSPLWRAAKEEWSDIISGAVLVAIVKSGCCLEDSVIAALNNASLLCSESGAECGRGGTNNPLCVVDDWIWSCCSCCCASESKYSMADKGEGLAARSTTLEDAFVRISVPMTILDLAVGCCWCAAEDNNSDNGLLLALRS